MGFFVRPRRCVISAEGLGRVVQVAAGVEANLWGLVLANGTAGYGRDGGCVFAEEGATLLLDGTVLRACEADGGRGGGVFASAGVVVRATDTRVEDAMAAYGGALYLDQGAEARLTKVHGETRLAENYDVHAECEMVGNTAEFTGGAVFSSSAAYVSVAGCSVLRNEAAEGGALMLDAAAAFVYQSRLEDNVATVGAGGAIFTRGETIVQLRKGNVMHSNSAATYGGAVFGCGSCSVDTEGTVMTSNVAGVAGGAMYAEVGCIPSWQDQDGLCERVSGCSRYDCLIADNEAPTGGGLYIGGNLTHNVRIARCTLANNTASAGSGGGMWIGSGANISVEDSQIVSNTAAGGNGGGVYLDEGGSLLLAPDPDPPAHSTLDNSRGQLTQPLLVEAGLAMTLDSSYGAGEVYDARGGGVLGSLLQHYAADQGFSTTIRNNSAAGGYGGGVHVAGGSLVALHARFQANYAHAGGGGLSLDGGAGGEDDGVAALWGCNFVDNSVFMRGAGVHAAPGSLLISRHTNFTNNTANLYGGGLYTEAAAGFPGADIAGGFFLSNFANSGGAVAAAGGMAHIYLVTMTGNMVDAYGGGVFLLPGGELVLNSSTLTHDTAPNDATKGGSFGSGGWSMDGGMLYRFNQSAEPGLGGNVQGSPGAVRFCGPCEGEKYATATCTYMADAPCVACTPCPASDYYVHTPCGTPTMFDDAVCRQCLPLCPDGSVAYAPCRMGTLGLGGNDLICGTPPRNYAGEQVEPLKPAWGHMEVRAGEDSAGVDYAEPPLLTIIRPRSGPVSGGTLVTIEGANFERRPNLRCRFGSANELDVVKATWVSPGRVLVHSPPRDYPITALVSCSNDGTTWSNPPLSSVQGGGSFAIFTFVHAVPAGIFTLDNTTGPFEGSTVVSIDVAPPASGDKNYWVTPALELWDTEEGEAAPAAVGIPTARFQPGDLLSCMFDRVKVKARWRTYQKIECVTPHYSLPIALTGDFAVTVNVSVSNNAMDYVKAGEFTYRSAIPNVQNVYTVQDVGFWKARGHFDGNTEVWINGTGFLPSEHLRARFFKRAATGSGKPDEYKYLRCSYDSPEQIRCVTPPWFPESMQPSRSGSTEPCFKVKLDVSNNGATQWSMTNPEAFLYGDIYVSLSGSDLWGDGTPKLPYRSITRSMKAATSNPRSYWLWQAPAGDTGRLATGREVRGPSAQGAGRYINRDTIRLMDGMYRNIMGFSGLEQNLMLMPYGKYIDLRPVNPGMAYIDCQDNTYADWIQDNFDDDPNSPSAEVNGMIRLIGVGVVRCGAMQILDHLDSKNRPEWYVEGLDNTNATWEGDFLDEVGGLEGWMSQGGSESWDMI